MTRLRILLVDDDPAFLRSLRRSLARDLDVVAVTDAAGALAALQAQSFDAIVSDLQLGLDDGLALLREVSRLHPKVRRGLMTGHVSFVPPAGDTTIESFFRKPVARDELLRWLALPRPP